MKKIPLSQGKFALVDDEDYERIKQHKWGLLKTPYTFYVTRRTSRKTGQKTIYMHREILGLKPFDGILVDHQDHNGLNNRRCNIRACTRGENAMNSRPRETKASRFKGIRVGGTGKGWTARIKFQGAITHLGTYATEEKAAKVYDKKAVELFGKFACLNFPDEGAE